MTIWLGLALTVETGVLVLAGVAWFVSRGYTLAESGAAAVLLLFVTVSLIHQIGFFTGWTLPGIALEAGGVAAAGWILFDRRKRLGGIAAGTVRLLRTERIAGWGLAAVVAGLAAWTAADWSAAARSTVFSGRLYGPMFGGAFSTAIHRALPPLNAPALLFHTARFGLAPGAAGFGLLGYLAVGCATYTLARRYAWPPMALTVTLLVLSMPRMTTLALHPTEELFSTAAIAASLVLLYRLLEQHRVWDLRLFLLCLPFSIDADPLSLARAVVIALLLMVVMIRRHGWLAWRELVLTTPRISLLILVPVLILAQAPVFLINAAQGHFLFGVPVVSDAGGLAGAAANLIRYLLISFDPTEPLHRLLAWMIGVDLNTLVMAAYQTAVIAPFGHAGEAWPFSLAFSGCDAAGFGPILPMLVLPAMGYALLRGPRRLKALSVAWLGYLYLSALTLAWHPNGLADLTPLYAGNGFTVAFALPPWRLRRRGMRLLQLLCVALLVGGLVWRRVCPG